MIGPAGNALRIMAAGIVLGAIVHVLIVLGLPAQAQHSGWSRIVAHGDALQMIEAGGHGHSPLPRSDPAFRYWTCRYNLLAGPVRLTGTPQAAFWSAAVFATDSAPLHGFVDRAARDGRYDIIIATRAQAAIMARADEDALLRAEVIETDITEGFVIFRLLVADPSEQAIIGASMDAARCSRMR